MSQAVSSNGGENPSRSGRLLISVLLFQQTLGAMAFPISKYGLEFIEPFTFAFYRFILSSICLLAVVKIRKQGIPIERQDWWKIIGLGVMIIPLNQTLFLYGQSFTAAGHGALLFATVPIWIFLAAVTHLKEKLIPRRAIGILIAICGVATVMFSGAIEFGQEYLWGDFMILIAVIAWAYYTIYGKPLVRKYGAIRVTAYALTSGSILYLPFGGYMAWNFDYSQATLAAWGSVVYMAIGTSVFAYVLWYWVLKYLDASRIAVFHNLQPLMVVLVAWFWLGEPIGLSFVIGGLISIVGVLIAEV